MKEFGLFQYSLGIPNFLGIPQVGAVISPPTGQILELALLEQGVDAQCFSYKTCVKRSYVR